MDTAGRTQSAHLRVGVIKPSLFGEQTADALPPLLFAILKALTPPDIELIFVDENIEPVPDMACDLVALSIDSFTARRGYQLADRFRDAGRLVVIGGMHASFRPDEAARHADCVVVGEAEDTWGRLLADLRQGRLEPRYTSENATDLAQVEYDYSVLGDRRYQPIGIVQFSRGCRFACDFCSVHSFFGSRLRRRPVAAVTQSIGQLSQKLLFFSDDNLMGDPDSTEELLAALRPLRRRWVCQISIDAASDPGLLRRMRQSGCVMVIMGFESLAAENLRQMRKSANLAADYEVAIENIKAAGLMLYGTFVIGYDYDRAETALELADYARRHGFAIANFNPLIATPGTVLYDRLEQEGRLLYERWWDDPDYRYGDTVFQPLGMSPQQLAESCRQARFAFYSPRGILARLRGANLRGLFQLYVYLLANLVSAASIRQKQGRRLGT